MTKVWLWRKSRRGAIAMICDYLAIPGVVKWFPSILMQKACKPVRKMWRQIAARPPARAEHPPTI
jgi:hypothetical protein